MSDLGTSTVSNNNVTTYPTSTSNIDLKAEEIPINGSTGAIPASRASKPKKQLKKLKDPEAPRRPLSPYMLFVRDERAKVVAEMGSMVAIGEVGKEMGKRWGLMGQLEKSKYVEAYNEDKARYEEEMKTYQPSKQFLDMKVKHDMAMQGGDKSETTMEKYFSFLESNWRKISSENPGLCAKEVQEIAWTQWSLGKMVEGEKPKKVKKIVDPEAPKKPLTAFFLFQKKMRKGGLATNAKGLAEMWKNMEEEGKRTYKEEEVELRKRYLEEVVQYKTRKV